MNHDEAAMKASRDSVLASPDAVEAYDWQARVAAFGGRLNAAHEEFTRAADNALRGPLH
jgi:hypothetical protein